MVKLTSDLQVLLKAERVLSQLGQQLGQVVTQFLQLQGLPSGALHCESRHSDPVAAAKGTEPPEPAIAQATAIALQTILVESQVVVLLWLGAAPAESAFPGGVEALLSREGQDASVLLIGYSGTGEPLTWPMVQALAQGAQVQAYPIAGPQRCYGWGLRLPSTTLPNSPAIAASTECDRLIQTALQQCATALEQLALIRQQQQHVQTLQAQTQELQQSNQRKSQFLANTSHEIRTPLSSILGFTHLLQQQGFNPTSLRHQEYLKIILSSGQHLLALINDILDLSKIEANQLTLQWETVAVKDVCQTAITLVREKACDKGLALQLDINTDVATLVVDGLRLKQMLFNLLSNAVKFTRRGAVGLQVTKQAESLAFMVWDTGTGIDAEQQTLLFKPYFQITNDAVARGEGTGLGLVLTQKLAELHGGQITVESQMEQGSQFTITLPLHPSLSASEPLPDPDTASTAGMVVLCNQEQNGVMVQDRDTTTDGSTGCNTALPTGSTEVEVKMRPNGLLLVEDNYPNAKLILTYLSRLGYEVTWAKSGKELWQSLERSLPAAILMDIHLPDTDGLTLIRQLKQHECYHTIPIIAQTAMAMKGDRDVCLEAGAADYISKPIALDRLKVLVSQYLSAYTETR